MPKERLPSIDLGRILESCLPKRVEACGSALVKGIHPSDLDNNVEYAVLAKGEDNGRPFAVTPKGAFRIGERVEIIKVGYLNPWGWLSRGPVDFNQYFARPWDPERTGKDLVNRGFKVVDAHRILDGQEESGKRDFRRRSDGGAS